MGQGQGDLEAPIILVLGMHRSGTSLISQMIGEWGAYLGEEAQIASKGEDNPNGFWEYAPLVDLNDKMLHFIESCWRNPPMVLDETMLNKLHAHFFADAKALVKKMDKKGNIWSWKDPRLPILLPFWRKVFEGRRVAAVIPIRHPLEVAMSLQKRNNLPVSASLLLWEKSIRDLVASSDFFTDVCWVDYHQLMESPQGEIEKLFNFLNRVSGKQHVAEIMLAMQECVQKELRHHKKNFDFSSMSEEQKALYEGLKSGDWDFLRKLCLSTSLFKGMREYLQLFDCLEENTINIKKLTHNLSEESHKKNILEKECQYYLKVAEDISQKKDQEMVIFSRLKAEEINHIHEERNRLLEHKEDLLEFKDRVIYEKDALIVEKDRVIENLNERTRLWPEEAKDLRSLVKMVEERELLLSEQLKEVKFTRDQLFEENQKLMSVHYQLQRNLKEAEFELESAKLVMRSKLVRTVIFFRQLLPRFLRRRSLEKSPA